MISTVPPSRTIPWRMRDDMWLSMIVKLPEPFLMKAGDAVSFDAIDRTEFDRLEREAGA